MAGSLGALTVLVMATLLHVVWVLDGIYPTGPWGGSIERVQRGGVATVEKPSPEARPQLVDVALDPGHSDADPGALSEGMRECDLTLPLAIRVKALLEVRGLTVALTRSDEHPLSSLSARDPIERVREEQEARIAAAGDTRVYVSLHFNGHPDRSVRGTETYYNASRRGEESFRLAGLIQSHLVASIRASGYAVQDRGVKEDLWAGKPYGHFFSLRGDSPSVLVEAMFLTNPVEASLLTQSDTLEAVARGIAGGIAEYLNSFP